MKIAFFAPLIVLPLVLWTGCAHEDAVTSHTSTTREISPMGVTQQSSTTSTTTQER